MTSNLRAVTYADQDDAFVCCRFLYEDEPAALEHENVEEAETEVCADFADDIFVAFAACLHPRTEPIGVASGEVKVVYCRYEDQDNCAKH